MKYENTKEIILAKDRKEINTKINLLISSNDLQGITAQDIYSAYSGEGGLHGLNRYLYESYFEYAKAKKEIENGQFFTPGFLCQQIVDCVPVSIDDLVADLTCGMGNFFNCLPNEKNCYGNELDAKALKVASFLYPEANLNLGDIRNYQSDIKFDIIFGNPPFNLKWDYRGDSYSSQMYFLLKCFDCLSPAGILAMIVPQSFLSDDFSDKSKIEDLNDMYSFLGQSKLPGDAFKQMGVAKYNTKVIFFQKRNAHLSANPYNHISFIPFNSASIRSQVIQPAIDKRYQVRNKIMFDTSLSEGQKNYSVKNASLRFNDGYLFLLKKLLFEIKTHPVTRSKYASALQVIHKFNSQEKPSNLSADEWERIKLTPNKVLANLRRTLKSRLNPKNVKPGIRLSKTAHGLYLHADDFASREELKDSECETQFPFHELYTQPGMLDKAGRFKKLFAPYLKLIARKTKAVAAQGISFDKITPKPLIGKFLEGFDFVSVKDKLTYKLNDKQQADLNLVLQKPFGALLNWQQGVGKTPGAWCVHKFHKDNFTMTVLIGPPIAIQMTWVPFLNAQNAEFKMIKSLSDITDLKENPSRLVLIPNTMMVKFKRPLMHFVREFGENKVMLIADESDEFTSYNSERSGAVRDIFRRCGFKLLTTGTPTRNNVAELYGQLELIVNNSANFICTAPLLYSEVNIEGERTIKEKKNPYYLLPFSGKKGNSVFKSCFAPVKSTVFGIRKHNQDIYNPGHLEKLIASNIITSKFKEMVGPDKYELHTYEIDQSEWERELYSKILMEFSSLVSTYFKSTGNSRKDSMLRLVFQLNLLIKACSIPQKLAFHNLVPNKAKKIMAMLKERDDKKTIVGCTLKRSAKFYYELAKETFPQRAVFLVTGNIVNFKDRQKIIDKFEATTNGILICTQQSLSSSVNIPSCQEVIIEALRFNLSRMEQFYFRTIRFDSPQKANIRFVIYSDSIEVNLMTLLLDKERINDFIKTKEFRSISEVFEDFKINESFLEMLIEKVRDQDGKVQVSWGRHKRVAA